MKEQCGSSRNWKEAGWARQVDTGRYSSHSYFDAYFPGNILRKQLRYPRDE